MENELTITKRTFDALNYPEGSPERDVANEVVATSEYNTSEQWAIFGTINEVGIQLTAKTKEEAERRKKRLENGLSW